MLTIKKRFPWRRLYFYGSGALIVGFAGIMTFLVQTNANIEKFVSRAPVAVDPSLVVKPAENTSSTSTQQSSENSDVTSDANTTTNWNGVPSSSATQTPAATNETPVQPTQPESTPTSPTEPSDPTTPTTPPVTDPETPPTVIDEIIDIIVPNP